ncbi:MAG: hypothetical protein H7Y15_10395 [Pseudonocardia sp.]|nr:hypothetical protein [Pseudonocardia sp.]
MAPLPTFVLIAGLVMIVGWIVAVLRVDRRWRRSYLQCCRCLHTWRGTAKLCDWCGARGQGFIDRPNARPTHDWQGRLDTGPIPVVWPETARFFDNAAARDRPPVE